MLVGCNAAITAVDIDLDVSDLYYNNNNNNNTNNPICEAPECQKTSLALADRNSHAN